MGIDHDLSPDQIVEKGSANLTEKMQMKILALWFQPFNK